MNVIVNAIKHCQDPGQIQYKFGVRVPRNYAEAISLQNENGNTVWQDGL